MADSSPKPKLRPKKSVGEKIKDFADKYNLTGPPTPATKAAQERFLSRDAPSRQGGLPSLASTNLGGLSKQNQYKENLRRYEEYMKSQGPKKPEVTPEMRKAALGMFESQQGAGQVPYYMAAARNAQNPNMSPAFQYAAQNYDVLGGSQRVAPRPMEMMSVAERRQINDMSQAMADQQAEEQRRAEEERRRAQQERLMSALRSAGSGKGGPRTAPQQSGRFNSMEELMEFQNQNPTMNLMGEYQRLKALEAGSQQAAANDYQAGMDMVMRGGMGKGGPRTAPQVPRPPMPQATSFAPMLMSRFGRFGS